MMALTKTLYLNITWRSAQACVCGDSTSNKADFTTANMTKCDLIVECELFNSSTTQLVKESSLANKTRSYRDGVFHEVTHKISSNTDISQVNLADLFDGKTLSCILFFITQATATNYQKELSTVALQNAHLHKIDPTQWVKTTK